MNVAIAAPDVVVPVDVAAPVDVAVARPPVQRAPVAGPWRELPQVSLTQSTTVSSWADPPDLDGDELPDTVLAVDVAGLLCTPATARRPCPAPDVSSPPSTRTLAFVAVFSSESPTTDASTPELGRLLGTRAVALSAVSPTVTLRGVSFSDFGPGILVRTTLDVGTTDVIDVVDLFAGIGAERPVGALVHHCARALDGTVRRHGALAVSLPTFAPLVWRAALSHPYTPCPAEFDALDRALGESLRGSVAARVTRTEPVVSHRPMALALDGEHLRLVERHGRGVPPDSGVVDALTLGDVGNVAMSHGCGVDRLRYTRGEEHCALLIDRDDPALPGCRERASPLDPAPPRPVALREDDAHDTQLVFARGASLWSVALPARCHHGGGRPLAATAFDGPLPRGLVASPDGARAIVDLGLDLWASARGHERPALLNPPGGPLPRGTTRDLVFTGARTVAAVVSTSLFELTVDDVDDTHPAPETLTIDYAEVRRALDDAR